VKAKWQDKTAAGEIARNLERSKGDKRYHLMRLLRHLSGDAMGPADFAEFDQDADGWARRWAEWAAKQ
jgi:hypothetical protein